MCAHSFTPNHAKTVATTLYLLHGSKDDPGFGLLKLTKLLYFADTAAYQQHGKPITGSAYVHFPHGPHPYRWHLTVQRMVNDGDVEQHRPQAGQFYHQYRLTPLRPPATLTLTPNDVAILDQQLARFAGDTCDGINQKSRWEIAWQNTEDGELLDYAVTGVHPP